MEGKEEEKAEEEEEEEEDEEEEEELTIEAEGRICSTSSNFPASE